MFKAMSLFSPQSLSLLDIMTPRLRPGSHSSRWNKMYSDRTKIWGKVRVEEIKRVTFLWVLYRYFGDRLNRVTEKLVEFTHCFHKFRHVCTTTSKDMTKVRFFFFFSVERFLPLWCSGLNKEHWLSSVLRFSAISRIVNHTGLLKFFQTIL